LLLSIFVGAYIFIRRAWKEALISQLKSSFISNISHELKTPLTSIKTLAELIEMEVEKGARSIADLRLRISEYLHIISRESNRLGRLIDNLLNFSKIERGVKKFEFEYEDPAAVLRSVTESFRAFAEAEGFNYQVDIAPDLPEVKMDADAISQAVLNLLSNAAKYSEERREIRVKAFADNQNLIVQVADKGVGIEPAEIKDIFKDFYRIEQTNQGRKQGGMGLGLTLVRHIVEAHQGSIEVESTPGKGSTFTITLPLASSPSSVKTNWGQLSYEKNTLD